MNEIKCIFCGIESNHVVIEENGYSGKKCPQCGLIYVSPRPSEDEIAHLYEHDSQISPESHIGADFSKRLIARHHLQIIRSFVNSGTLLEIGPGAGYFLDEARKIGFDPYGLEINHIQATFIRNELKIPCEEPPLSTSIFGGRKFDIIYHCDVLSHFINPILEFNKMNEIMNDGSFLIFETGNIGEVDPKYFKYFNLFLLPEHLFFYNTENLVDLLVRSGFKFVKMYRYSILPYLKVKEALRGIYNVIKKIVGQSNRKKKYLVDNENVGINSVPNSDASESNSLNKESIRNIFEYLYFVFNYKLGRVTVNTHRPQTLFVVARKSEGGYSTDNSKLPKSST